MPLTGSLKILFGNLLLDDLCSSHTKKAEHLEAFFLLTKEIVLLIRNPEYHTSKYKPNNSTAHTSKFVTI